MPELKTAPPPFVVKLPANTLLFANTLCEIVTCAPPATETAPPKSAPRLDPSKVRASIVTPAPVTLNGRTPKAPRIETAEAPGPWIVTAASSDSELFRTISPASPSWNETKSPGPALAISCRRLPDPESFRFVTWNTVSISRGSSGISRSICAARSGLRYSIRLRR